MTNKTALGQDGFLFGQGIALMDDGTPLCELQSFKLNIDLTTIEIKKGETTGKYIFPVGKDIGCSVEFAGLNPLSLEYFLGATLAWNSGKATGHIQATLDTGTKTIPFSGKASILGKKLLHIRGVDSKKQYIPHTSWTSIRSSSQYAVKYTGGSSIAVNTTYFTQVLATEPSKKFEIYWFKSNTTGVSITIDPLKVPGAFNLYVSCKMLEPGSDQNNAVWDDAVFILKKARIKDSFELNSGKDANNVTINLNCPNDSLGDAQICMT